MKPKSLTKTLLILVVALIVVLFLVLDCRHRRSLGPLGYIPRQGKLEQPLIDYMASVPTSNTIGIVVVMNRQVTADEKRELLHGITGTNQLQRMEKQRLALAEKLASVATTNQVPLLAYLRPLETNSVIRQLRPLWLSNVIGLEAPSEVISNLAGFNEVAYIHLDLPQRVFQGVAGTGETVTWGIKKIQADKVPPISGQSKVVVAVLDTGVYTNHSELKSIWNNPGESGALANNNNKDDDKNGYKDDVIGWNFTGKGNGDPKDENGHGTHVAGIIAGDGTTKTRTGVAPFTQIMVLREADGGDRSTERGCWEAMQYAITNKARILNFSSGWDNDQHPDSDRWRQQVENLTDSGVLLVTSAGDYGSPLLNSRKVPYNITVPARVPAALAVGCTDSNDLVDEAISSTGPVTWSNKSGDNEYPYNPGPGLIKPDLVAPGVPAITSLKVGGDYTDMFGTSMAAPHVAGVGALLLAKNPNLTPFDLRFILEETADPIGSPRPNSKAGWGRVNAKSAFDYIVANKLSSAAYNLAVDIIQPPKSPKQGESTVFAANVSNNGGQVVGNVEIGFYFADAQNRSKADLNNGSPKTSDFKRIGSCSIPIIGPAGSNHASFPGSIVWKLPHTRQNHWWLGVWVKSGPPSTEETDLSNNGDVVEIKLLGDP